MSNLPFGYLLPILFLAWCTYFVVAPSHWHRALRSFGTYFEVINEVPFFALFWIISSTIWAFIEGDLAHPIGKIAFGLALLVIAGLVVIIYWDFQSAAIVSRALNDGLGEGWQTLIPVKMQKQSQKKFTAKALLGPFFNRRFDVQRTANIRYGDAGERNLLDVYRSRSHPNGGPVLIHLHGGSFVSGRKNTQSLPLLYELASRGWVCISANYRLGSDGTFLTI